MSRHLSFWELYLDWPSWLRPAVVPQQPFYFHQTGDMGHYVGVATDIDYPDTETSSLDEVTKAAPPLTLDNPKTQRDVGLEPARGDADRPDQWDGPEEPGGRGLRTDGTQGTPASILSIPRRRGHDVHPVVGREPIRGPAWRRRWPRSTPSSRPTSTGTGTITPQNVSGFVTSFRPQILQQDLASFQTQIGKTAADGTEWYIRHNAIRNEQFVATFLKLFPAEWDHERRGRRSAIPFMQGAGVGFNRIAGPGADSRARTTA